MGKITKSDRARHEFENRLYAILRNYQQGAYHENARQVVVGALDVALTAVYDDVREAAEALLAPKRKEDSQ